MAPKRRAGRKPPTQSQASQSQSQTQTQTQTQPTSHPHSKTTSTQDESSCWVATLPPQVRITVAILPEDLPFDPVLADRAQQAGEEAAADAWLKKEDVDGRVEVKWSEKGRKRRKVWIGAGGVAKEPTRNDVVETEEAPAWYTATLFHPCTCQLPKWKNTHQPRYPPPLASKLHILPSHDDPSERPIPPHQLPEWDDFRLGAKESMTDLEPALDQLKEFEPAWRSADGGWGRGWGCEEVVPPAQAGPSGVKRDGNGVIVGPEVSKVGVPRARTGVPIGLDRSEWWKEFGSPALKKGKGKAESSVKEKALGKDGEIEKEKSRSKGKSKAPQPITTVFRPPLLPTRTGPKSGSSPISKVTPPVLDSFKLPSPVKMAEAGVVGTSAGEAVDWQAESKRRKQLWRRMIEADDNYGQMWSVIEKPHSFPARFAHPPPPHSQSSVRPRDFVLSSALSLPHPYHPSLTHYIKKHPYARVYWLIPINGPVHMPCANPLPPSKTVTPPTFSPSTSSLTTPQPFIPPNTRPFPLLWTPSLLTHFMSLLVALYMDPSQQLGALSIRLSGPKPDAYIDLPYSEPLSTHAHVPAQPATEAQVPVRPECGDHIRIYVDAKHALALRNWLQNVDIPWNALGDHGTRHAHERARTGSTSSLGPTSSGLLDTQNQGPAGTSQWKSTGLKVFNRVRLVLVGERGEALVLA